MVGISSVIKNHTSNHTIVIISIISENGGKKNILLNATLNFQNGQKSTIFD